MAEESITKRLDDCEKYQGNLQTELKAHQREIAGLKKSLRETVEILQYFLDREQPMHRDAHVDAEKKVLLSGLILKLSQHFDPL